MITIAYNEFEIGIQRMRGRNVTIRSYLYSDMRLARIKRALKNKIMICYNEQFNTQAHILKYRYIDRSDYGNTP